jgi:putative membrane protein
MKKFLSRAGVGALLGVVVMAISFPVFGQQDKTQSSKAAEGALSKKDAKFLRNMGEADLAEVQAGKLAASKASSPEVKKFAQHMVEEHSKGLSEGQSLAKAKRVEAPAAPNKKHRAAMKKLESQSGAGFDKAYMNQMVQDHQEALKLVRNASKNAKDPEIRAAAEKKVPVVEKHLQMARETAASLKGDSAK